MTIRSNIPPKKTPTGARNGRGRGNKRDELRRFEVNVLPRMDEVINLAKEGYGKTEIAKYCDISYEMFLDGFERYPEHKKAFVEAFRVNVKKVKSALLKKAIGYDYVETKEYIKHTKDGDIPVIETSTKHLPPDTSAISMYLRNYDEEWRDRDWFSAKIAKEELELKKKKLEEFID